jgi:hypothetical protein
MTGHILDGTPDTPGWYWWRANNKHPWQPRCIILGEKKKDKYRTFWPAQKDSKSSPGDDFYVYYRNEETGTTTFYVLDSYGGEWWSERLEPPPGSAKRR